MHDGYGSRGAGGGGGYYSAPTDRIRETNHNIMEMQNNAHIDDLSDQVLGASAVSSTQSLDCFACAREDRHPLALQYTTIRGMIE